MDDKSLKNIITCQVLEMEKSFNHLKNIFYQIRVGKANTDILNNIYIKYHGSLIPLNTISNISVINSTTLSIQPWDTLMISIIEKSIINSNMGFTPIKNNDVLLLKLPPLTEESRKKLVKKIKYETENMKIRIRNIRQEANKSLKKLKKIDKDLIKDFESKIQDLTNKYIKKIEQLFLDKEKEIMTI